MSSATAAPISGATSRPTRSGLPAGPGRYAYAYGTPFTVIDPADELPPFPVPIIPGAPAPSAAAWPIRGTKTVSIGAARPAGPPTVSSRAQAPYAVWSSPASER